MKKLLLILLLIIFLTSCTYLKQGKEEAEFLKKNVRRISLTTLITTPEEYLDEGFEVRGILYVTGDYRLYDEKGNSIKLVPTTEDRKFFEGEIYSVKAVLKNNSEYFLEAIEPIKKVG